MEEFVNPEAVKQGGIVTLTIAFLWLTIQHFRNELKEQKAETKELRAENKSGVVRQLRLHTKVLQKQFPEAYALAAQELVAEQSETGG